MMVYKEERQKIYETMSEVPMTVCVDGWTCGGGVSCVGISLGEQLWSVVDTGTESHTRRHLGDLVLSALATVEAECHCVMAGICYDGASNMEAMRCRVMEARPGMFSFL